MRKVRRAETEGRPYQRPAALSANVRRIKKLTDSQTWFKRRSNHEYSILNTQGRSKCGGSVRGVEEALQTVIFVKRTPGGYLAKDLRAVEANFREITPFRVKVVERAGRWIKT